MSVAFAWAAHVDTVKVNRVAGAQAIPQDRG